MSDDGNETSNTEAVIPAELRGCSQAEPGGGRIDPVGGIYLEAREKAFARSGGLCQTVWAATRRRGAPLGAEVPAAKRGGNRTEVDDRRLRELECQRSSISELTADPRYRQQCFGQ